MRSAGVEGVIIRATHGSSVDTKLTENVAPSTPRRLSGCRSWFLLVHQSQEGFGHRNGEYRQRSRRSTALWATPTRCTCSTSRTTGTNLRTGERRRCSGRRSPGISGNTWSGCTLSLPGIHIIAYSNASFWDGAVSGTNQKWVGDPALAAEIDWIVPRYPVWPPSRLRTVAQRNEWAKTSSKPPKSPSGWAEWAFDQQPAGPKVPSGVEWAGWQFSADYNRLGGLYGCSSADLISTSSAGRSGRSGPASARSSDWVALASGDELKPGEARTTDDGHLNLTNVSVGDVAVQRVIWSTGTGGKNRVALVMQPDGNLVQRDGSGAVLFETGTTGNPGAELRVDRNGVAAVVAPDDRVLWSSSDGMTTPDVGRTKTARVRRGDGWIKIADRELGDGSRWQELRELNGGSSRVLHEGDEIRLP